ncbi:hypothetical protein [Synechococcus sp. PCC 7336]|uniref:hypothetical protein n=1 Tax=Synechococcus sp. PCC 7336 TaxID=195250 RepID=UPI00034C8AFF|nr:hypothetical protein [Synechococcus sp. PCC 7336]
MANHHCQGVKARGWGDLVCLGIGISSVSWLLGWAGPTVAQTDPDSTPTEEEILQACASGQAESLPNPYIDLDPADWYYDAVIVLYYCGAYRGAIPPEVLREARPSQQDAQSLSVNL